MCNMIMSPDYFIFYFFFFFFFFFWCFFLCILAIFYLKPIQNFLCCLNVNLNSLLYLPQNLNISIALSGDIMLHAYSNILNISPPKKNFKFSDKNSDIFHVSAPDTVCRYEAVLTNTTIYVFVQK